VEADGSGADFAADAGTSVTGCAAVGLVARGFGGADSGASTAGFFWTVAEEIEAGVGAFSVLALNGAGGGGSTAGLGIGSLGACCFAGSGWTSGSG